MWFNLIDFCRGSSHISPFLIGTDQHNSLLSEAPKSGVYLLCPQAKYLHSNRSIISATSISKRYRMRLVGENGTIKIKPWVRGMSAREEAVKQGKMTGSSRCWWWGLQAAAEPNSLTGSKVKNFQAGIQVCFQRGRRRLEAPMAYFCWVFLVGRERLFSTNTLWI